jgi:hypothetical protein
MRARPGLLVCLTAAALAIDGCASGSSSSDKPLTGLGATADAWKQAHGGLNTATFSEVKSVPEVYSFKQSFPASTNETSAQGQVQPLLPPDAKLVVRSTTGGCLRLFYVSAEMQKQAPQLGNQLSAYYYSSPVAGRSFDPKHVQYAVVTDLGYTTAKPCYESAP